ncbi:probable ras-related GTP-binding protein [Armillaria ostoyae]|uniref:Rheb small monomeric GTPase RhbA n=3 Tax=Armillaria TaxID=47424 RepID=A0A2H3C285_9AGAR|nr:small GTPase superfamily [Armillaria nabsnona]PBK73332.1 rheb small monomeric GTPase RhbA [Armillaria solidipes]PBK95252.1 rheb small monomeric GTPase RhbA [Armillaria gallica]SJK96903.1 probable ras-related GTP-binding protein [Armillaria ostoyae]
MQKRRKIAVLGTRSVGKSSLVKQFVENEFPQSYYPTIEKAYVKAIVHNGQEYICEIYDTAGQDEYSQLNVQHAIGFHGYVFVYSITSRASFDLIQIVYDKLLDFSGNTELPCVIVGTKSDLHCNRQVDMLDGKALAAANNAAFTEASSKNNVNVARAFELCLEEIEKRLAVTQGGNAPDHRCVTM